MKKLTVLSIMAASLLLIGCGDSATGAEAKASATEHKTESAMKCGEGKCGGDKKSVATQAKEEAPATAEKTKEVVADKASEAKEAVSKAVEKTKEAVAQKASEAKEAASKAVESVKEKAASAVDSAKAAAASVASAATAAVAAATDSGPDGKALFAKCAGCHGADGKTKAMGKSALLAGQSAADLETKIAAYKAGTRNETGMGALMKGQVGSLSDADVKAIATYISGL